MWISLHRPLNSSRSWGLSQKPTVEVEEEDEEDAEGAEAAAAATGPGCLAQTAMGRRWIDCSAVLAALLFCSLL